MIGLSPFFAQLQAKRVALQKNILGILTNNYESLPPLVRTVLRSTSPLEQELKKAYLQGFIPTGLLELQKFSRELDSFHASKRLADGKLSAAFAWRLYTVYIMVNSQGLNGKFRMKNSPM